MLLFWVMKHTRMMLFSLIILQLFLLSGCANLVQEMTVREDGSGSIRFALGVETNSYLQFQEAIPEGFNLENILSTLMLDDLVTGVSQRQFTSEGLTWDSIQLEISDMAAALQEDRRLGPITVSIDEEEDGFFFQQRIALSDTNLAIPGINLMDLTGSDFTVKLTTPQMINSNGIQLDGGTTVWEVPLRELLQGGETLYLQANYVLEPYEGVYIPWETFFPYIVYGFLGVGGLSILVIIIVNTLGKKDKTRTLKFK